MSLACCMSGCWASSGYPLQALHSTDRRWVCPPQLAILMRRWPPEVVAYRSAWSRRCLRCLQLRSCHLAHVVAGQRIEALVTGQRPVRVSVHRGAPDRRGFSAACTGWSLRLVFRSRMDGALSRSADISVSTQRHGCGGCPVSLRLGWDESV
jgi:hypothetical protein